MMLTKRGEWFHLSGRDPQDWRKRIRISLHTKDQMEALVKAGEIAANIKRGIEPKAVSTKIKLLVLPNLGERDTGIRSNHIDPFFGDLKPIEIEQHHIEQYMEHRWGRAKDGRVMAVKNTWKKEGSVLVRIMRLVDPAWKLPKIEYKATFTEKLPPLTFDQVGRTANMVLEKYRTLYWVMVYTGMDIMDAVTLAPCHLKDGWIVKARHKTERLGNPNQIRIPICKTLEEKLSSVPRPLNQDEPLFAHIKNKNASKEIRKAFKRAGLAGYGAKYLRRYVASVLLDNGFSREWIGKALAHSEGSDVTMDYPGIYDSTLVKAFKHLDRK